MKNLTLTEILDRLTEVKENIQCDINADWNGETERAKERNHLASISIAIACLETIKLDEKGQVFKGCIEL